MSERQIKEYYERTEKLLNGANKETYGFAPQEIKNILISYEELQNQNQELKNQLETLEKVNKQLIYKLDRYDAIVDERDELKKQLTTYQILHRDCKVDNLKNISKIEEMENQQKDFISYLENEKDRLARECSHIYENSLGKTRFVNEDIFNEVDTILSKYKSIIGGKDE